MNRIAGTLSETTNLIPHAGLPKRIRNEWPDRLSFGLLTGSILLVLLLLGSVYSLREGKRSVDQRQQAVGQLKAIEQNLQDKDLAAVQRGLVRLKMLIAGNLAQEKRAKALQTLSSDIGKALPLLHAMEFEEERLILLRTHKINVARMIRVYGTGTLLVLWFASLFLIAERRFSKSEARNASPNVLFLNDFSQPIRPDALNLNEILTERSALYRQLCGSKIQVVVMLEAELFLVPPQVHDVEKLILNLLLITKHNMPFGGSIQVSTSNVSCSSEENGKQYVRLLLRSLRNVPDYSAPGAPPQYWDSKVAHRVVSAVIAANDGIMTTCEESELVSITEVLLPAAGVQSHTLAHATAPKSQTLLPV